MKINTSHTLKTSLLSLFVASALTLPVIASPQGAPATRATRATPAATPGKAVSGKVSDKGSDSLTVDGIKYTVTDSTTFTKGGVPSKVDEIKVGDEVRITVAEGSGMKAATVEIVMEK